MGWPVAGSPQRACVVGPEEDGAECVAWVHVTGSPSLSIFAMSALAVWWQRPQNERHHRDFSVHLDLMPSLVEPRSTREESRSGCGGSACCHSAGVHDHRVGFAVTGDVGEEVACGAEVGSTCP